MKQKLLARFLPPDYEQIIFNMYQNCVQGQRSVFDYTTELYRLSARNNVVESEQQKVARYLHGLKPMIRNQIGLQTVWVVEETHNLALKAKMMDEWRDWYRQLPFPRRGDVAGTSLVRNAIKGQPHTENSPFALQVNSNRNFGKDIEMASSPIAY